MPSTARVLNFPSRGQTVKLDDGPRSVAFIQREIFASRMAYTAIANKAGLSNATVGNIASGETKRPALSTIVRIAAVLGWSIYAEQN